MEFKTEVTQTDAGKEVTVFKPSNDEFLGTVRFEGDPRIGDIREILLQACDVERASCGASVTWNRHAQNPAEEFIVSCTVNRCTLKPNFAGNF